MVPSFLSPPRRQRLRKMCGFHGNGTNPFNISAKMPAMLDSIVVKILTKIGFHRQTPCHHVYNYIHIYISLLTRGKMVRRKANFSPSPPKVASIFEIFIERKSGEIGETSGVE